MNLIEFLNKNGIEIIGLENYFKDWLKENWVEGTNLFELINDCTQSFLDNHDFDYKDEKTPSILLSSMRRYLINYLVTKFLED